NRCDPDRGDRPAPGEDLLERRTPPIDWFAGELQREESRRHGGGEEEKIRDINRGVERKAEGPGPYVEQPWPALPPREVQRCEKERYDPAARKLEMCQLVVTWPTPGEALGAEEGR